MILLLRAGMVLGGHQNPVEDARCPSQTPPQKGLSLERLEDLGVAFLDFTSVDNLVDWLG
jgi:hypothetical protein